MEQSNTKSRKVRHRKEKTTQKINRNNSVATTSTYISTFLLFVFAFLIYDVIIVNELKVNIDALNSELINEVHNQNEAVEIVIKSIDKFFNSDKNVYLNFVGSTGIGKTFIVNIIKKHFLSSVHDLSGSLDITKLEQTLNKLKSTNFKHNVVIIDDLTVVDVNKIVNFIQKIPQDIIVLVISIFNIQETDDSLNFTINYSNIDKIRDTFRHVNDYEMIQFHEFSEDQVKEWIIKQLVLRRVEMESHTSLVEAILKDQIVKYYGLKGLSAKINLEL